MKRQVKYTMRNLLVMFVTAFCFLFLLKLKWPKNKNFQKEGGSEKWGVKIHPFHLPWIRACITIEEIVVFIIECIIIMNALDNSRKRLLQLFGNKTILQIYEGGNFFPPLPQGTPYNDLYWEAPPKIKGQGIDKFRYMKRFFRGPFGKHIFEQIHHRAVSFNLLSSAVLQF